jgi:hypothetical protein
MINPLENYYPLKNLPDSLEAPLVPLVSASHDTKSALPILNMKTQLAILVKRRGRGGTTSGCIRRFNGGGGLMIIAPGSASP